MLNVARFDAAAPPGESLAGLAVEELGASQVLTVSAALVDSWHRLGVATAEPNPFLEHWFLCAGLRNLQPPESFRLLLVRDDAREGELVGLMPLVVSGRYGRIPLRHVQNWMHYHSFLGAPLVRHGWEERFWAAVLDHVDASPWAAGLFHVQGLVEDGPLHRSLRAEARKRSRDCDTVHRTVRALLQTDLSRDAYFAATVRKKKRKELARLRHRLEEHGRLEIRSLAADGDLVAWCDAFLALEQSGWKGEAGSALASDAGTDGFFRDAICGAHAAGRLDFIRMDLDGRPLAMLASFLTPPGSYSFKIAFDEAFARFSPGVLLQIENLRVLDREDIDWTDSCAAEDHPMINSLWGERRSIVRVTLPLSGRVRGITFRLCRTAERGSAALRKVIRTRVARAADHG